MSKELKEKETTRNKPQDEEPIEVREFFEKVAPGKCVWVKGMPRSRSSVPPSAFTIQRLNDFVLPDIELHCPTEITCDGFRTFAAHTDFSLDPGQDLFAFIEYRCRNCRESAKVFAIQATRPHGRDVALVCKFGERPPFGPPLPSKLIELIRPEWDDFQKGRRCENQGLGIGAFGYYRRVIESQKNRILDEIIKAARKLNVASKLIKELTDAKSEAQFTKALDGVKSSLPDQLMIAGENPLLLLHDALSEGMHRETDEECLKKATDIRLIMTELAERLSQVLKEDSELKAAVSRLQKSRQQRASGSRPI
jgi:hypothetical protein